MPTILKPRLDIAFKSRNKKANRKPIKGVRIDWENFINYYAEKIGADVVEYLLPEITPDLARRYDDPYVPHRGKVDGYKDCHFYMQTVFPHLFSVDTRGWGGDLSFLPVGTDYTEDVFPEFQQRISLNQSFFPQPERRELAPCDIFFAAQLPHDLNVMQQSDVGVQYALKNTLEFARAHRLKVVAKGHPVWGSQAYQNYGHVEWSDASIHDLIESCRGVVTVNSGVGMEAVLHEKPVFAFGRANYSEVTADSLDALFDHTADYRGFFNAWYSKMEDYTRGD